MSSSNADRKRSTNVKIPSVALPKIASVPRNPRGWNTTEITIRSRGQSGLNKLKAQEPAGDPPGDWPGSRPEWAIYWALTQVMKLSPGSDFIYGADVGGVEASYYSTVDFYFPDTGAAIEVQGSFWHMGLGSEKQFSDITRKSLFAQQGINVVFVDEEDCLADPIYYVKEAIAGRDHSAIGREY